MNKLKTFVDWIAGFNGIPSKLVLAKRNVLDFFSLETQYINKTKKREPETRSKRPTITLQNEITKQRQTFNGV